MPVLALILKKLNTDMVESFGLIIGKVNPTELLLSIRTHYKMFDNVSLLVIEDFCWKMQLPRAKDNYWVT